MKNEIKNNHDHHHRRKFHYLLRQIFGTIDDEQNIDE